MKFNFTTTAPALGMVRALVHGAFLISILVTSLSSLSYLPVTILRPTGVMHLFSWEFYGRLLTPGGMLALKCALTVSLLMSTCGYLTRFSTVTSALLVIFYQGLLRSFGHFNHDEMLGMYYLVILAFSPCGDGFSIDSLPDATPRRHARSFIYGYPIFLMRVLMGWIYFSSALVKLRVAGLGYFSPDNLPALAIAHSLDNLHDTHFRLAFLLPEIRQFLPLCVGIILIWELLFPLAVWWKRARPWILLAGIIFHLATLFLINVFFPIQLAMYLVFVDWPATFRKIRRRPLFKQVFKGRHFFSRMPETFPCINLGGLRGRSMLLWDGENTFAASLVYRLQRTAKREFNVQTFQTVDVDMPERIQRLARRQIFWVDSKGTIYGGSRALIEALSASGHAITAAILDCSLFRPFIWAWYHVTSRTRKNAAVKVWPSV